MKLYGLLELAIDLERDELKARVTRGISPIRHLHWMRDRILESSKGDQNLSLSTALEFVTLEFLRLFPFAIVIVRVMQR